MRKDIQMSNQDDFETISIEDTDFVDGILSAVKEEEDYYLVVGDNFDTGDVSSEIDPIRIPKIEKISPHIGDNIRVWLNLGHYARGCGINGKIIFYESKEARLERQGRMAAVALKGL